MRWSLLISMQRSVMSKAAERSKSVRSETSPKCQEDAICYFEKGSFSAIVRAVSGLRRTDELMFSEIG